MLTPISRMLACLVVGGALFAGLHTVPQGVAAQASCDWASYPDFCIPYFPPALTCSQIGAGWFTVNPPDPHFLDTDFDGVGCEG